ncbi:MAG: signal peptidase II [Clostridiales bacterium]|nr:signal peptidase II [Roseburia sp.]MDD7635541.1 signal peptidase II [Clostridiales bacterium]MDY4112390.1 signal peptidase II [Roseburia sp.]
MSYLFITAGVFLLDFIIKSYMDKKYARKVQHPRLNGAIILEKYYNRGAALNLLSQKPKILKFLHTAMLIAVGTVYYFIVRYSNRPVAKTGLALLLGGGLSNLFDRYTKGHVVDYFRINIGPKWLRRIIFNVSDFCVFIGALLAALSVDGTCKEA